MVRRILLLVVIASFVSSCATINGVTSKSSKANEYYEKTENNGHTSNKILAYPIMAAGAIMIGFGALITLSFDAENSETESQSEAQNALIGLGLLGGGYLLWELGNHIEQP